MDSDDGKRRLELVQRHPVVLALIAAATVLQSFVGDDWSVRRRVVILSIVWIVPVVAVIAKPLVWRLGSWLWSWLRSHWRRHRGRFVTVMIISVVGIAVLSGYTVRALQPTEEERTMAVYYDELVQLPVWQDRPPQVLPGTKERLISDFDELGLMESHSFGELEDPKYVHLADLTAAPELYDGTLIRAMGVVTLVKLKEALSFEWEWIYALTPVPDEYLAKVRKGKPGRDYVDSEEHYEELLTSKTGNAPSITICRGPLPPLRPPKVGDLVMVEGFVAAIGTVELEDGDHGSGVFMACRSGRLL